ncbi:unnamed protein product [Urochloa humidicola]
MSALVDAVCAPPSSDASAALIYDTFSAATSFLFDGPAAAALYDGAGIAATPAPAQQQPPAPSRVVRKRRRRARSCKSREETETQRMTHIAVERNRRRQMNEYLAALRSLMPEPYIQRGDQASIVGGAIEYVKELEQQLQCLEAQKRTLLLRQPKPAKSDATPTMHDTGGSTKTAAACAESSAATTSNDCSSSLTEDAADHAPPPPFARFFTYPQYVWCQSPRVTVTENEGGARAGVADIEVTVVETHASLRVMAPRRPGQLLGLLTGLQALRLPVLHLSVATMDALALYTISVKLEEGCGLATVDDIAGAVHHVLCIIDAETSEQRTMLAAS